MENGKLTQDDTPNGETHIIAASHGHSVKRLDRPGKTARYAFCRADGYQTFYTDRAAAMAVYDATLAGRNAAVNGVFRRTIIA